MAGRGSPFAMMSGAGGLGLGGAGGPQTSTRPAAPGQLYGPKVRGSRMGSLGVHHYLWLLVLLEIGILVAARLIVFRPYHGG